MTDDERRDLLELKVFLERAISLTENDLLNFPITGDRADYRFLIDKAIMYRENLKKVSTLLQNRNEDE